MGPLVRNGGRRPGDAATISEYANVGRKPCIAAGPMLHRRIEPKDIILVKRRRSIPLDPTINPLEYEEKNNTHTVGWSKVGL